jgi:hypothetical protein
MAKHHYIYLGEATVQLPLHGIVATGGDQTTIYTVDEPIHHPDFHEVTNEPKPKRKERATHK